jgi:hypothetical protein
MSSAAQMHAAGSKTSVRSDVKRGAMTIMVPITTDLTDSALLKKGAMQEESRPFPMTEKGCVGPWISSHREIEKYDVFTNPAEWLEVYQLAIKAISGDSYVMENYLLVCLSSSSRTWLLGLPMGSVCSWNHLCWLFTSNFRATCARPGVDWDLASAIQKKGEYLREFI